jgi:putative transposase
LREHELGGKTAELCRKHRISEATFYNWKSKFGGLDVSEARRLKQLEGENARLKKLLADSMLDNAALKDLRSHGYVADHECGYLAIQREQKIDEAEALLKSLRKTLLPQQAMRSARGRALCLDRR